MTAHSSLFISHGAPTLPLEDSAARRHLEALGRELPKPRAVVVLSPHWLTRGFEVKSPARFQTWHDFGGFPEELYRIQYTPPGDGELAAKTLAAIRAGGLPAQASDDVRLDHGAWVPLMLMYPKADVPVVQVSATLDTPRRYFELGRALQPLATDGALIIGSGGIVHNLREIDFGGDEIPAWARSFEDWTAARLAAGDWDTLCDYRRQSPDAARAHPTEDHFLPMFFAGGAGGAATPLHRSFSHGSLGMDCYGFG